MRSDPVLFAAALGIFSRFSYALPPTLNTIRWVDCANNVPAPLQGMNFTSPLPSTLHCGQLDVPMDYSKPIGDSNTITLGFTMYRPNNSQGLINFNPGGPGQEVASYSWEIALNLERASWFAGLEGYDILAIDTRGWWSSNALNCSLGNWTLSSSLPSDEPGLNAFQASVRAYAQTCIDLSTPPGIVQYIGTREVVQDWDRVRAALDYDIMHHFGISYGTYYGALYAHTFPEHVGRFALDAVFTTGVSNVDLISAQYAALDRSLIRSDAYCLNDTSCPLHSQGKGAILEAFQTAVDLAGPSGSAASSNVTADDVRFFVGLRYLVGDPDFAGLNNALYAATQGNWSLLDYSTFAPVFTEAIVPIAQTYCLDYHVDDNTFEGYSNLLKVGSESDPLGIKFLFFMVLHALCTAWPYTAATNPTVPINASMVLVTSDFDYNTPTELATIEWSQAPNSVLVVRHGDDHGSYNVPGPARSAFINFLATGSLPAATNQTFATIYEPGSQRNPIPDPYLVPVGIEAGDM
ncbi:Alpha/beta-hydrolase [Mycena venus]|uniref:Alpha/beta-hydrolase n=1 Tax=Mycena venus TaxID=2733690 RepID=A0A8H7D2Z8_9AGAR|nr:Alpha/beta-hydrolase [Mycena venus]